MINLVNLNDKPPDYNSEIVLKRTKTIEGNAWFGSVFVEFIKLYNIDVPPAYQSLIQAFNLDEISTEQRIYYNKSSLSVICLQCLSVLCRLCIFLF